MREIKKMEVMGRLVGGVAHDFNNVLTTVTLYSDLLLAGLASSPPPPGRDSQGHGTWRRAYSATARILEAADA